MKPLLALLLALAGWLPAAAQRSEDFAQRFMSLYADSHALSCTTVSPAMMERVLSLDTLRHDDGARHVISQLRSIRVVTAANASHTERLLSAADSLASVNRRRYTPRAEGADYAIYVRERRGVLVEVVVFLVDEERRFNMLDFTGNMSEDFLSRLARND